MLINTGEKKKEKFYMKHNNKTRQTQYIDLDI